MEFEKHLKQQFVNQMKNIKEMEENNATEEEIKEALTYNLAISECMNICKSTEEFLNQSKEIAKMLNLPL